MLSILLFCVNRFIVFILQFFTLFIHQSMERCLSKQYLSVLVIFCNDVVYNGNMTHLVKVSACGMRGSPNAVGNSLSCEKGNLAQMVKVNVVGL